MIIKTIINIQTVKAQYSTLSFVLPSLTTYKSDYTQLLHILIYTILPVE